MKPETLFDLASPKRVFFGKGSSELLLDHLVKKGKRRLFVLMDKGVSLAGVAKKILGDFYEDVAYEVYSDISSEPTAPDVDRIISIARKFKPDSVAAIGGGSVLDIGKLCSVLIKSDLMVEDLLSGAPVPEHKIYTVLIPTTSGTGSEATKNAIISIPSRAVKEVVIDERLLPDLVLLDPVLTITMPSMITATTGIDALCHALEGLLSKRANQMSDMLALEAIRLITGSIRVATDDPDNLETRTNMLLAAYYGGICITLAGTNAVHALSYPLGALFHIPHGLSNAILLPLVIEYNTVSLPIKATVAAECLGYDSRFTDESPSVFLTRELNQLVMDLGINTSLSDFGVTSDSIPMLSVLIVIRSGLFMSSF